MTRRRLGIAAVLTIAALLLLGRLVTGWMVEYRWFEALGATSVFWAATTNLALLRGTAFGVATALLFANLYAVRYSVVSVILPRRVGDLEIGEELPGRTLTGIVLMVSLVLGFALALPHSNWTELELVRHGEMFRESDPYFQADLAFWIYWLPLEEAFHAWATTALLVTTALVTILYALTPSLRWNRGRLHVSGHVRRHLFLLSSLFLLVLAWKFRLDAFRLLLDGAGSGRAFLAIDHRLGLPGNLVLAMASVVVAMLVAWAGWNGQLRLGLFAIAAMSVLALSVRQVAPPVLGRYLPPSEVELRDRPYLATRAAFSRRAFDVDRLVTADSTGPRAHRGASAALWDSEALRRQFAGTRGDGGSRGSLGWAVRDGRLFAIMAQPPVGPEPTARWTVALADPALGSLEGGLVRPIEANEELRALPPVVVADSLLGGSVVIDSTGVIASPGLASGTDRLVHAWGLQNPRLLGETPVSRFAKVMRNRDVRTRVALLYPYFAQGNRVTPVVLGDSLWWVVHLYSASGHYPLSDPIVAAAGDVTYFRHAAVAMANAHTGRVTALRNVDADPVARSWFRRLPRLFVAASAAAEDLLRQLPPPTDGVLAQARVFARFGRRGEQGPASRVARETGGDTLFAFPSLSPFLDGDRQRLAVAYPILDAAERLRGVISASGGADPRVTWHPLDPLGPEWNAILERMRRALDTAGGSSRTGDAAGMRGPVRAMLHGGSVTLLQSAYAWEANRLPALRWAAVALRDTVRVARSLGGALGVPEPEPSESPLTPEAFRESVERLYARMGDALARRDLASFAETWDALGRVLRVPARPP